MDILSICCYFTRKCIQSICQREMFSNTWMSKQAQYILLVALTYSCLIYLPLAYDFHFCARSLNHAVLYLCNKILLFSYWWASSLKCFNSFSQTVEFCQCVKFWKIPLLYFAFLFRDNNLERHLVLSGNSMTSSAPTYQFVLCTYQRMAPLSPSCN